jgi:hypothetical protein
MILNNIYFRQIARTVIITLVVLLIWKIGGDWFKPFIIESLGGYTARENVTVIDTVEVRRDTIYIKSTPKTIKVVIKEPTKNEQTSSSTKGKIPTSIYKDSLGLTGIYTYNLSISDTLLQGNIKTVIDFDLDKITSQNLNYSVKIPKLVKEYTTIEKSITETLHNKPRGYIGTGITITSDKTIGGLLIYQTPKKLQYQVGYNRQLINLTSNTTSLDIISVSIVKLF